VTAKKAMKTLLKVIDTISEWSGKTGRWVAVVLILVLSYEVIARHVFDAPTIWAHAMATMLGGTVAALGWSYTHRLNGHVRVDVFYMRLSPRGRALIDVVGSLLLFFPLIVILARQAAIKAMFAWSMGERLSISYWYPPATPIRIITFIGLSLFALQGLANFIRDFYMLVRNKPNG